MTNLPANQLATMFLLTDGSVLAQGKSTNQWYRLTPASNGDYGTGTWTTVAASTNAPLYYGSGILRDGRLIIAGGEYNNGAMAQLLSVEIYDPVANTWTTAATPAGWTQIGDAPSCVLPDGRFFLGRITTRNTAIFDPTTGTWTATADKLSRCGEESWSLLPDGTVHAVDCYQTNAEKYVIAADTWVDAGAPANGLADGIREIGASVLLPDGRLFVIGATGFTGLYTPPAVANQVGTWVAGPTIPNTAGGQAQGAVDAPACLLPNGNVFYSVCPITNPASFQSPTEFFEYDPVKNQMDAAPLPTNANTKCYVGRMLMLPTGQVMYTNYSTQVDIYTPSGTYDPMWRPNIVSVPTSLRRNTTYTLTGRQLNGLSQCTYYGNDSAQATNYPIVRLESTTNSNVYYCRTHNFSTMGLQTGTTVHSCDFTVPLGVPLDSYNLVVVANGIPSQPRRVSVTLKVFKELKAEIKEKVERIEIIEKFHIDTQKRIPDIIDPKLIRENIDFGRFEEEWVGPMREFALQFDQMNEQFVRSFIPPELRPQVGPPAPVIDPGKVKKISAAEAKKNQIKSEGVDIKKISKEMQAFNDLIHHGPLDETKSKGKSTTAKTAKKARQPAAKRDRRRR
jgi:hypothetical protein